MKCLIIARENKNTIIDALHATQCIQMVCDAEDSAEAEDLCYLYSPEVVIVDVKEKESNEIINVVENILPKAHIIAYTDYQSFSFEAEIANRDRTIFLLRPCDRTVLIDTIYRIAASIELSVKEEFSPTALSDLVNDYVPIIRQHYLSMLMRRSLPQSENIPKKFNELNIDCPGPYYTVIVSCLQSNTRVENYEAICFLLRTHIKSEMIANGLQCYIFFDSDFNVNCLVGSCDEYVSELLEKILNSVKYHFEQSGNITLNTGIGRTVEGAKYIHYSYEDADIANVYAQANCYGTILFDNIAPKKKAELTYERMLSRINEYIMTKQFEEFEKVLLDTYQKLEREGNIELTKEFSIKLTISLLDSMRKNGINGINYSIMPQLLAKIYAANDYKEIYNAVEEIKKIITMAEDDSDNRQALLINGALAYIDSNLGSPDLSLDELSDYVGLSKSYFCIMFKEVMGQGFSDYIRGQRVERAKSLLKNNNKKTYEISSKVGFRSPKYFSSVFKAATGMSPSEYQKKYKNL